ncbi:hypothetical protein Bbelb_396520 [Branchiostoma belcheri]|nr:hypothetical protein Bbelb_396520 [Branchiostoma belcheri]
MIKTRSDRFTAVVLVTCAVFTTNLLPTITVVNGQDGSTGCKWSLSGDEQSLYRRTSSIDWGDTQWDIIGPEFCWSGGWTCSIASERYREDGQWKDLSSLAAYGNSEDVFRISYEDKTTNRCRRRRFVEWKVNTTDTTLTGLVIQLNIVCSLSWLQTTYSNTDCLVLRPTGDELNTAVGEPNTTGTECGWTFENERQTLYRRTTQLHWGDTDWPTTNVSKIQISPDFCDAWTCAVQSERFRDDDGQWKGLLFLGQVGIPGSGVFHLYYKDNRHEGNCSRHWFVQWVYTEYIAQLRPLSFQLGITCSSTGEHTETACITFETGERREVTTTTSAPSTTRSTVRSTAPTTATIAATSTSSSTSTTTRPTLGASTSTATPSARAPTTVHISPSTTPTPSTTTRHTATSPTPLLTSTQSTTPTSLPPNTSMAMTERPVEYCLEDSDVGGLTWPQTIQGTASYHPCPNGTIGQIKRVCSVDGTWGKPDLFNCTTLWIQGLQMSLALRIDQEEVLQEMTDGLVSEKPVNTFDIIKIIDMIGIILERQEDEMQFSNLTLGDKGDPEVTRETRETLLDFAKRIIKSSSSLLKDALNVDWMNIPEGRRIKAAAALLARVEKLGILLASLLPNDTISIIDENIVFAVGVIFKEDPIFPDATKLVNTSWSGVRDSITLPHTDRHAVATLYSTIHTYLTNFSSDKGIVNSRVISATIVNGTISEGETITIFLKHSENLNSLKSQNKTANFTSSCNYWNFNQSDWVNDTCKASSSNMTHTTCVCNHLTNFAILARVVGDHDACKVVAIILHYLFLAAFAWMCVEGMELYALLVQIFNLQNKRVYYYHLIGYGVPAVVVLISVGVNDIMDLNGYGTQRYCWLSWKKHGFIWSFVGPMLFMILVNLGFLIMTLRLVYVQRTNRELTNTNTDKRSEQGRGKKFRFWIRVSVTLICLLGLTWLLGVLYISRETVVFAYFFTIANSFQVQKEIQRYCFPKKSKIQRRRPTGTTFRELLGSFSSRSAARRGTETTSIGTVGSPLRRDGKSFIKPSTKSINRADQKSGTTERPIALKSSVGIKRAAEYANVACAMDNCLTAILGRGLTITHRAGSVLGSDLEHGLPEATVSLNLACDDIWSDLLAYKSLPVNGLVNRHEGMFNRNSAKSADKSVVRRCILDTCNCIFNTVLSDERRQAKGVTGSGGNNTSSECRWTLADHEQYLYRRTSQIHWPDQDWPVVSPETCWGWKCFITSQKFLQDRQWKDLSSLGHGVSDSAFTIAHEENGRAQHCHREWFIQWEVTSDITRLDGMDIYINVVCTLSYLGAMHTKSNCLTLRTTEKLIAETMETDSDVTITSTAQPRSTLTNGDCQWRFADDRQYLYRRTTRVGWSTTDWPTSQITKMAISPDFCGAWTCSVDTQRFLDSGELKDLSSLEQGVDDDIFAIAYKDTINEGNCTRQWFVKWNYTTAVSRLGPLIFQLGVICTSVGGHTETGCLVLKTEGTHQQQTADDAGCRPSIVDCVLLLRNKMQYSLPNLREICVFLSVIPAPNLPPSPPTTSSLPVPKRATRVDILGTRSVACQDSNPGPIGSKSSSLPHDPTTSFHLTDAEILVLVRWLTNEAPNYHVHNNYRAVNFERQVYSVNRTNKKIDFGEKYIKTYYSNTDITNKLYVGQHDGSCQGQSNVNNNTSAWVRELQTFLKQSVPAGEAISMVLNRLSSVKIIISGDIITIVHMLSTLVEIQERQLQTVPQEERRGIATNFTQAMIQCGSIVLKEKYRQAWNDVPLGAKPQLAASLSDSLEKSGILMAKTVPSETFSISEENVVMDIVPPTTGNATYPNLTKVGNSSHWSEVIDRITLPPVDRQVVVALYNTLGDYFNTRPGEKIVNSRVISATLVNSSSTEAELGGNVTITLGHTKQDETVNLSTSSCSFWDQSRGNWSTEGCTARVSDDNHTICECNHLTNFAILVDVIGHEDEFALHVITYIGCIISIFCLIFCIFVFLGSRRVRCPRTIILANLCICLLVAEVVFLAAVDKTQNKDVCTGIAIALHYLFLTVFAWMCVEGIELYVMLVRVFNLKSSRMVYYYLIGYVTWVIGMLYIDRETIVFAYAFAIINSLQVQDEMIRGISGKRRSPNSMGSMTTFRRTLVRKFQLHISPCMENTTFNNCDELSPYTTGYKAEPTSSYIESTASKATLLRDSLQSLDVLGTSGDATRESVKYNL